MNSLLSNTKYRWRDNHIMGLVQLMKDILINVKSSLVTRFCSFNKSANTITGIRKLKVDFSRRNHGVKHRSIPAMHCHGLFYVKGVSPMLKRRITSEVRASLTFFRFYRTLFMDISQILEHGRFKWILWHMC